MRFILYLFSLIALSVAVIMAVVDATRSIATAEWSVTSLMQSWNARFPQMLSGMENYFTQNGMGFIWDPVLVSLMALPGWLLFAALALVFYMASRPPRRVRGMAAETF
ncbi:hypothetical protein [Nitratireductor basaltis]|uniref:Uncharacterized protein n=1 Tax=Nitratireductor basaltis TaxID=472175 RepID=A0A084U630_9HYPH|nr:hypothetical protein [Nitratireductor basaltis]KFB08416.1 hypothetical protein EL18_02666 [Nitratireductor basaltis]